MRKAMSLDGAMDTSEFCKGEEGSGKKTLAEICASDLRVSVHYLEK